VPITSSTTAPVSFGVAVPYVGVKSVNLPVGTLRSIGLRWPLPCQIPAEETCAVVRVPSAPMPRLARPTAGALSSTPFCIRIPLGAPVPLSK
jgi:hypothetical protein